MTSMSQPESPRLQFNLSQGDGHHGERPQSSGSESAKIKKESVILEDNYHAAVPQPRSRQHPWTNRPRSPNLKWQKGFDEPEHCRSGRVFMVDYVKQDQTKQGMRKVAAQEFNNIHSLKKLYATADRGREAVLRVLHVQNAQWATQFLLNKFNISDSDDLVGTTFGRYVKYRRPERRGGKPFLSGKSWKTTHDPWRGISRTSFGLDYLRPCETGLRAAAGPGKPSAGKMMELNCYDDNDNPVYGYDVYVQRISCYIQKKEAVTEVPSPDFENPYLELEHNEESDKYVPHLETLDNESTIIIFENSQSGSIHDTLIAARQQWESRWRRLPFYLAYENHDVSTDDRMASECMKLIIQDIFKSVTKSWEKFLDIANNHVSILEDKIYEEPADESRAPELWTNSSWWLKVERLVSIHSDLIREMQTSLHEMSDQGLVDNWLTASTGDMERISNLVQEDLVKPTASLADLMYKSVGIRDSRHGLQLNTSLWRLSWITFIFLPLAFTVGFFGMRVDAFATDVSIKWYFIVAVSLMAVVLLGWYTVKSFFLRRRQTPYSRGIYDHLFHEMATSYPAFWSRSGPLTYIHPTGPLDRLKWRLILFWNQPQKTIRIGTPSSVNDAEFDDLGTWARCKRVLTRRWTYQIRSSNRFTVSTPSPDALEGAADSTELLESAIGQATDVLTRPVVGEHAGNGDLPAGTQRLDLPSGLSTALRVTEAGRDSGSAGGRPSSQGSSKGGNSGVMVEEEKPTWLQDWRDGKERKVAEWLGTEGWGAEAVRTDRLAPGARGARSESRRGSHVSFEVGSAGEGEGEGGRRQGTHP